MIVKEVLGFVKLSWVGDFGSIKAQVKLKTNGTCCLVKIVLLQLKSKLFNLNEGVTEYAKK
jgi:hypothetical protein